MKIILILLAALVLSVILIIWGRWREKNKLDGCEAWQTSAGIVSGVIILIMLCISLLVIKIAFSNSEIIYYQLMQERQTLEFISKSEIDFDRILLWQKITEYNSEIIRHKNKLARPFLSTAYSPHVDWSALELIEWTP